MVAVIYPLYKQALLDGSINTDLTAGDIRVILVDLADYTYSAAHNFLDDVAAAGRVSVTAAGMTTKTVANGAFNADDSVFASATGDPSEAMIGYIHTGVESTARLIWFDDASTGLPITPNGEDINVTWGANIFAL